MQTTLHQNSDKSIRAVLGKLVAANEGDPFDLPDPDQDPNDIPDDAIPQDGEYFDDAENVRRLADELLRLRQPFSAWATAPERASRADVLARSATNLDDEWLAQDDAHCRSEHANDIANRLVLPSYLRNAADAATRKVWAEDYAEKGPSPVRDCFLKLEKVVRCFKLRASGWDVAFGDDARALREAVVGLRSLAKRFDALAAAERVRADIAWRAWSRQSRSRYANMGARVVERRVCLLMTRTRSRASRRSRTVARVVARCTADPDGEPESRPPSASSSGGAA
jgi:hypothetical protein